MELTTALGFLLIAIATAAACYAMKPKPESNGQSFDEMRDRLAWEQRNKPAAPRTHSRMTYHA